MCSSIGVDPLASNKGFWSDLLGVGDFYYEIGVQILQIGVQTRAVNGGILSLHDLLERVQSCPGRSKQRISRDDVKRAIEKIAVLGSGVKMIQVCVHSVLPYHYWKNGIKQQYHSFMIMRYFDCRLHIHVVVYSLHQSAS
jgi:hypothetical protein